MRRPEVYWRALRREWSRDGWEPTDWGIFLSLLLFVLLLRIGLIEDEGLAKADQFFALKLSEMGDTIAGLFSALAFIWIIVTVFIQSRELREQRKEFKQQREATQDMARAMGAQAQIFEDEKRQRNEAENGQLFDQLVSSLVDEILRGRISQMRWEFSDTERSKRTPKGKFKRVDVIPYIDSNLSGEKQISSIYKSIDNGITELLTYRGNFLFEELEFKDALDEPNRLVATIIGLLEFCPQPHRERARRMKLAELNQSLQKLINTPNIWKLR